MMKKIAGFFVAFYLGCLLIHAQNPIQTVNIESLKKIYTVDNDTTYIINFFATWCAPCIQEIPVLNTFYSKNSNTKNKLILVSLDKIAALKFLQKKVDKLNIKAPVFLLNANSDYAWLPQIDTRWQGSIPATMVINNKKNVKAFFETPLEEGQLEFYLSKLGL